MKSDFMLILKDLTDDHNMVLYALFWLAVMTPELRSEVAAAMAAFWVKDKLPKKET